MVEPVKRHCGDAAVHTPHIWPLTGTGRRWGCDGTRLHDPDGPGWDGVPPDQWPLEPTWEQYQQLPDELTRHPGARCPKGRCDEPHLWTGDPDHPRQPASPTGYWFCNGRDLPAWTPQLEPGPVHVHEWEPFEPASSARFNGRQVPLADLPGAVLAQVRAAATCCLACGTVR